LLDVYAAPGRPDEACEMLERACDDENRPLFRIGVSREYDLMRDEPRFPAAIAKMGLRSRV
jgi:hypothetical protein